jgi:hypothetical protein
MTDGSGLPIGKGNHDRRQCIEMVRQPREGVVPRRSFVSGHFPRPGVRRKLLRQYVGRATPLRIDGREQFTHRFSAGGAPVNARGVERRLGGAESIEVTLRRPINIRPNGPDVLLPGSTHKHSWRWASLGVTRGGEPPASINLEQHFQLDFHERLHSTTLAEPRQTRRSATRGGAPLSKALQ